jgi:hypothetical protein
MEQLTNQNPQPLNLTVQTGGGGGGFFGRMVGAIIASCLLSLIGYLGMYTTLAARLWLKKEGAVVEMPAEKKAKKSVVERSRGALGDTIGKIKEQLVKTKETATGGLEKAKDAGAHLGKNIEHKVDKKAEELKLMLAHRQEESR